MKIASAQIESIVGDIKGNLKRHLEMIDFAGKCSIDLIVFPEMSLTGYCRKEGRALALKESDNELIKLKEKSKEYNLIIVVGSPIEIDEKLYIGSFVLLPSGRVEIYTKQYLHLSEESYYSCSFDYNPQVRIANEIIAFAICADINHLEHPKVAKRNMCTIYLPSICYSKEGISAGHKLLSKYAKENSFEILMSNYSGNLLDMELGGKSGFWDKQGRLRAELDSKNEGLLIIEKSGSTWVTKKFKKKENTLQQYV